MDFIQPTSFGDDEVERERDQSYDEGVSSEEASSDGLSGASEVGCESSGKVSDGKISDGACADRLDVLKFFHSSHRFTSAQSALMDVGKRWYFQF